METVGRKVSLAGLLVIALSSCLLQAQDYVLAWDHPGADHYRVAAEGHAPVVVKAPRWSIPESMRTARSFIVEACTALDVCTPSAPLPNVAPAPPTNLQVGVIGNGLPIEPPPPPPEPPSGVGDFFPANGATEVPTGVTLTGTPTGPTATSCQLKIGTVNPPTTGPAPGPSCSFPFTGVENETYFWTLTPCNAGGCATESAVQTYSTVGTPSGDLLTVGDNFLSAGWSSKPIILSQGLSSTGVAVYDNDAALPTQTNVITRWPDASIRMAQVTASIPADGLYNVRPAAVAGGTFAPVIKPVVAEFTIYTAAGVSTVHTATMPLTVNASDTWYDGPFMKCWRHVVTPDNSPTGFAQHLRVYFDYCGFSDGTSTVDVIGNNMKRATGAGPISYSLRILIDGAQVYSRGGPRVAGPCPLSNSGNLATCNGHGVSPGDTIIITSGPNVGKYLKVSNLHATNGANQFYFILSLSTNTAVTWDKTPLMHSWGTRWVKNFKIAGHAEAQIEPDLSSLFAAKALPTYLPNIVNKVDMELDGAESRCWSNSGGMNTGIAYANCWDILGIADYSPAMGDPGSRDELGFTPGIFARYIVNKTQRQRALVLRYGELGGSWGLHHTHAASESMVDLDDVPSMFFGDSNSNGGALTSTVRGGYTLKSGPSHLHNTAYLPWLLTGRRYYAEELKYRSDYAMKSFLQGRNCGAGTDFSKGCLDGGEPRMVAYAISHTANAANYLPDTDEHKAYFATKLVNQLTRLDARIAIEDAKDPILKGTLIGKNQSPSEQWTPSLWQNAYIAFNAYHAIRQGHPTTGVALPGMLFVNRIVDYQITLLTSPDWSTDEGAMYNYRALRDDLTHFTTMQEMYDYNFVGAPPRYNVETVRMAPDYGPDVRLAVLVGLATGRPNAAEAYTVLMDVPTMMDGITQPFSGGPPSYAKGPWYGIASIE